MPPPELSARSWSAQGRLALIPPHWRQPLAQAALAWLFLLVLFRQEWGAMAAQWWNSSTYNHILFVPLLTAWLVSLRAKEMVPIVPATWAPGVAAMAMAMFVWLLGAVSGLDTARQLGAVIALQASVLALLGPRVTRALAFPLGYMLFLVPFGDELVPPLQMLTARMTVALTQWSGIPAAVDGIFIDTPAGLFRVAEACSGVKFLVAMAALGVLVAHLCFRSWRRRALFLLACIVVPVLANGVRAWGTIYAAQFQGIEFARGMDHVVYGWLFFALVIALVLGIGWRFFDRDPGDPFLNAGARSAAPTRGRMTGLLALSAILGLAAGAQAWARTAVAREATLPTYISFPEVPGWIRVGTFPSVPWTPSARGADHRLLGSYADATGARVDVFYALYRSQDARREAGGFGQGALVPGSAWSWVQPGIEPAGGKADWLQSGAVHRLAITYYRTGDVLTGSNLRLKMAVMCDRLLLARRPTAVLIVSAVDAPRRHAADAIAAFRRSTGDTGAWMDAIGGIP